MLREEEKRIDHERMVSHMEQEELALIQRLQNTQMMQKEAYDDLESALLQEETQKKVVVKKTGK